MKDDLLHDETIVIHSDESTLVVSKKPNEDKNRKNSYVYVYRSGLNSERQIMIYSFNETRGIAKTAEWLKDYEGTITCDDYAGYNLLKKENCNFCNCTDCCSLYCISNCCCAKSAGKSSRYCIGSSCYSR